jgi:hypothetical protein
VEPSSVQEAESIDGIMLGNVMEGPIQNRSGEGLMVDSITMGACARVRDCLARKEVRDQEGALLLFAGTLMLLTIHSLLRLSIISSRAVPK